MGKKEPELILTQAAQLEKLKQRLRRRKCVFADENLCESSKELERQADRYPADFKKRHLSISASRNPIIF